MPGAGCLLLCTKCLNKRIKILSIKIAQDGTNCKCGEHPRARSPTLKKQREQRKEHPMKETKHRSARWALGAWALVLAAAVALTGCGGASDAAAPAGPSAAADQSSASSRSTPGAAALAAQTDRITDQYTLEKNVSGVWGGRRGAVHFRPCAQAGMRQPGCCKPEQGACRHLCGGFPGI